MINLKKNLFFAVLFLFAFSFSNLANAKIETVIGLPLAQNKNLPFQTPETSQPEIMLSKEQYLISYNKDHRSPNWVAWKLEISHIGKSGRSNNFSIDSDLENFLAQSAENKHAVDSSEYKGSCFDRGHQVPSADRSDTMVNNEATFLMSNMIPQTPYLNRVIWKNLEQYSRDLVQKEGKKLYIVAGPIYDQNFGAIGPQKDIPVPSKEFKIIYILESNQTLADIDLLNPAIAVLMPNVLQDGSIPDTLSPANCNTINKPSIDRMDWQKYTTTLNEIERLSGLHFFHSKK